jgi:RND family efflux transporter MFP subunit
VSGPGRTDALEQQKVRAPFKGILSELRVADGDRVSDGQVIVILTSQESEAALTGARAMLRSAETPQQRADAERALQLARRGLVKAVLRAPEAGVVVAHGADEGGLVAEAQDVVSLAATDSFVFLANIVQTELPRIRPGEPAEVHLAAESASLPGTVHGVLASASAADLAAPVRIDFAAGRMPKALGLFGTAVITVGERRDVPIVPQAAVLRDDINGVQRIAVVSADGKAQWREVKTGAVEDDRVEIAAPALRPGTQVIVDGQVGLPEGAKVLVAP